MKILVYGLPGSGKTTFAKALVEKLGEDGVHLNADDLRREANDWDFSDEGRRRQVLRMLEHANAAMEKRKIAVLDFVCPRIEYREMVNPDVEVYMARKPVKDYEDTTGIFEPPPMEHDWSMFHVVVTDDYEDTIVQVVHFAKAANFDWTRPTAQMLGRFQPFHDGHVALFEKALEKHGQVAILVRTLGFSIDNPLRSTEIIRGIRKKLVKHAGKFVILEVPNIVDVVHGRDVGWTVSRIELPPKVESISATKIRKKECTACALRRRSLHEGRLDIHRPRDQGQRISLIERLFAKGPFRGK